MQRCHRRAPTARRLGGRPGGTCSGRWSPACSSRSSESALSCTASTGCCRGSLDTANSASALPFAWPAPPDSVLTRGLDTGHRGDVDLWGCGLRAAGIPHRTGGAATAVVAVVTAIVALSRNHSAMFVALVVGMEVLHSAAGRRRPRWARRTRLGVIGAFAFAWLVVCAGVVVAANGHPIIAQPGLFCSSWGGGNGIEAPSGGAEGTSGSLAYTYRPGKVVVPVLCLENRSWTRSATILSVANRSLPVPGPWHGQVVDFPAPGPLIRLPHRGADPTAPERHPQREHQSRLRRLLPRRGRPDIHPHHHPTSVRTSGDVQVDRVRLSQPIQTRCP